MAQINNSDAWELTDLKDEVINLKAAIEKEKAANKELLKIIEDNKGALTKMQNFCKEVMRGKQSYETLAKDFAELHSYEDAAKCEAKAKIYSILMSRMPTEILAA